MKITARIYYEDTDCGGVVYYANYLKYFERGRTELLRSLGVSLAGYHATGTVFVVTSAEARYLAPCRYDDLIIIETKATGLSGATMTFDHTIKKEGSDAICVKGRVTVASVGADGRPVRVPEEVRRALESILNTEGD